MTVTVTVTYVSTYFGETPEGTGQAEDYRLKLPLGKRANNTKYEY